MRKPSRSLTKDDWARAALDAIGRAGLEAVAVEPIAAELGTTKGSFYWHFKNRDALIQAALDTWEERRTDAVIAALEREPDPATRLRTLMLAGVDRGPTDRVEVALLASPGHPAALKVVRRVSRRRIDYLAAQLEALGCAPDEAMDRAVLIACLYVGYLQMAHVAPREIPAAARRRQVARAFDALVPVRNKPAG